MGTLQEMILHQEEVLVDDHQLTAKDLKFHERGELVDYLMEILEMMDHQMMEDILQDKDHQEEEDLWDHQEEDHLAPWLTWKSWAPRKSRTSTTPWTTRTQRTPWTTRTYGTTGTTWTNHWTVIPTWKCSSSASKNGYIRSRKNFSWYG